MSATAYPTPQPHAFPVSWAVPGRRIAPALDLTRLLRDSILIVGLLLTNALGTPGSVLFFAVLVVMVFRSPEAAFKAIAICYLGLMLNKAFVPKSLVWTPGRLAIPYLVLLRLSSDMASLRLSLFSRSSYIALLLFVAVMALCSVMSGWYTNIALLKVTNFVIFMTTIYSAMAVLRTRRADLGEWFVSLILAATLFGLGSVAFGVSRNFRPALSEEGRIIAGAFNGAFLHPNVHSTYASLIITFLAIVWILSRYRHTWLALPPMACWFAFMAWSASRTAFIASTVAILLLIAYARPVRNRLGWLRRPNLSRGSLVALGIAGVILVFAFDLATGGSVTKSVVGFINKSSGAEGEFDTEKILASRKALVEYSWRNFLDSPVYGIGFGVAKTQAFVQMATLFTAPSEKGFLPTAILEEGGILGTTAFVMFLCTFLGELLRDRNAAGFIAFIAFLATNIGEVTILSPGGGGSFGWTMVAAAVIFGDRCWAPPAMSAPRVFGHLAPTG